MKTQGSDNDENTDKHRDGRNAKSVCENNPSTDPEESPYLPGVFVFPPLTEADKVHSRVKAERRDAADKAAQLYLLTGVDLRTA